MSEDTGTKPATQAISDLSSRVPAQHYRKRIPPARVTAIDLRIGLTMLGEEGRKLLADYIAIKQQRLTDKSA